jgi:hypothetical protein
VSDFWSPLHVLMHRQRQKLGLGMGGIAIRCGCDPSKGARLLYAIGQGDVRHPRAQELLRRLPTALDLPRAEVDEALAQTLRLNQKKRLEEEARWDADWRASFRPNAYFDTESQIPTQITIFLITGGPDQYLKIAPDLRQPPMTFASQATKVVKETDHVPFFGKPVGFFINYSPDSAIRFGLGGEPIDAFDRAYNPGSVTCH